MFGRLATTGLPRTPRFAPQSVFFNPPLIDPDGEPVLGCILVKPVLVLRRGSLLRVQASGNGPIIPQDRMQHIIARHLAFASSPDAEAGVFYPEYSTPPAQEDLADDIYAQATSDDIGPSRGNGRFAIIAGALLFLNTGTGQTQPRLVGTVRPGGMPTNIVVMFVTSTRIVWTMYPAGPIVQFRPL